MKRLQTRGREKGPARAAAPETRPAHLTTDVALTGPHPRSSTAPLHGLTRVDVILAVLVFGLSMALYVRTLAPGLLLGDSGEFQTLVYTLGMTHATGYPVYLLVAHVFTRLPLGEFAYRVNLFTAVMAAVGLALIYVNGRLLGGWRGAAFGGCPPALACGRRRC